MAAAASTRRVVQQMEPTFIESDARFTSFCKTVLIVEEVPNIASDEQRTIWLERSISFRIERMKEQGDDHTCSALFTRFIKDHVNQRKNGGSFFPSAYHQIFPCLQHPQYIRDALKAMRDSHFYDPYVQEDEMEDVLIKQQVMRHEWFLDVLKSDFNRQQVQVVQEVIRFFCIRGNFKRALEIGTEHINTKRIGRQGVEESLDMRQTGWYHIVVRSAIAHAKQGTYDTKQCLEIAEGVVAKHLGEHGEVNYRRDLNIIRVMLDPAQAPELIRSSMDTSFKGEVIKAIMPRCLERGEVEFVLELITVAGVNTDDHLLETMRQLFLYSLEHDSVERIVAVAKVIHSQGSVKTLRCLIEMCLDKNCNSLATTLIGWDIERYRYLQVMVDHPDFNKHMQEKNRPKALAFVHALGGPHEQTLTSAVLIRLSERY